MPLPGSIWCVRIALAVTAWACLGPHAALAQELPPELAVVPQDTVAIVHFRPAELWSGGPFGGISKLYPHGAEAFLRSLGGEDPAETESFSILFPSLNALGSVLPDLRDGSGQPAERLVFIETTVKPFDRAGVLERVLGKATIEKKHQGKIYFTANPKASIMSQGAVWFVNDRTYVYAMSAELMDKHLESLARPRTAGPLDAALILAGRKRQLVLGFNATQPALAQVRKKILAELRSPDDFRTPPMIKASIAAMAAPLLEMRSAAVALSLGKELRLEGEATFPTERDAAEAQGQLEDALTVFRIFVLAPMRPEVRRQLEMMIRADEDEASSLVYGTETLLAGKGAKKQPARDIRPIALAEMLLRQVEPGLRKARVEQRQATLKLLVQVPFDADALDARAKWEVLSLLKAQESTRLLRKSAMKLQTLMLAMHDHHDVRGHFPGAAKCDPAGKPLLSWRVAILPLLGEQALYRQFKMDEPWDSPHNIKLLPKMPAVYAPPAGTTKEPFTTFYQVFTGPEAMFELQSKRRLNDVLDGTANTIGIVEAFEPVPWTRPIDLVYDAKKPLPRLGGVFPDGFHAVFVDGSVHFLRHPPEATMRALITFAGGEATDIPGVNPEKSKASDRKK